MKWASPWAGATRCTSGPAPGARALLAWLLEAYPQGRSDGIFNCREVRGAKTKSLHSEGRAVDYRMPMVGGKGSPEGHEVVKRLGKAGDRLGVQAVIYDRRIWSARSPEGRTYTGVHPHYDHIHAELTSKAAGAITLATFRAVLGGADLGAANLGGGSGGRRWFGSGDRGDQVRAWQKQLNDFHGAGLKADGIFGPATEAATKAFQKRHGLVRDGKVGSKTLQAMRAKQWFGSGDRGDQVRAWQKRLNDVQGAGLKADGIFGPATEAATKAFQKRHGLVRDGKVGSKTLRAMRTVAA